MDEFIKLLDKNLDYIDHKITDDICCITVSSNRKAVNALNFSQVKPRKHID